jgi:hypothetical protein
MESYDKELLDISYSLGNEKGDKKYPACILCKGIERMNFYLNNRVQTSAFNCCFLTSVGSLFSAFLNFGQEFGQRDKYCSERLGWRLAHYFGNFHEMS